MVQRALVGAADVHAGAAANGLEPFEHLDCRGVVIAAAGGELVEQVFGHRPAIMRGFAGVQAAVTGLSETGSRRERRDRSGVAIEAKPPCASDFSDRK